MSAPLSLAAAVLLACLHISTALIAPTQQGSNPAARTSGFQDTPNLLKPDSLKGASISQGSSSLARQSTALNLASPAANVQAWAASAVGLSADQLQLFSDIREAAPAQRHVRFKQVQPFQGGQAKVLGGDLIVHINVTNTVYAVTGTLVPGTAEVELPPTVSLASAAAAVVSHMQGARARATFDGSAMHTPELTIVPTEQGLQLVWCTESDLTSGPTPAVFRVCTAAHGDGAVLESRNVLRTVTATGKGKTLHSGLVTITTDKVGTAFYLRDPTRGNMYTTSVDGWEDSDTEFWPGNVMTDADNTWGNSLTSDAASAAADAHYGMRMAYDYYKNVLGRKGIDGTGQMQIYSRVHYSAGYDNAFWDDWCGCMTYGDGNDLKPLVSLDVAGHELTHGVTSNSAGLIYEGESGGLNEAMSDIFGTMIEYYANSAVDKPDYLIGERLFFGNTPTTKDPQALRYMYQPSRDGASPDCWYDGIGKKDVHYSSGPANHWYYLLAEGSKPALATMPRSPTCNGAVVVGVGRTIAAKILYRALTIYMSAYTDYADARLSTLYAAWDLYGYNSVNYKRVDAAWAAIGVVA